MLHADVAIAVSDTKLSVVHVMHHGSEYAILWIQEERGLGVGG